jgi:succinyl-diaminopimelate desuccinylase
VSRHEPTSLAQALIREQSITPDRGAALRLIGDELKALGFRVDVVTFSEEGWPDVPNLYARIGDRGPNFCFAGHSDVVPVRQPDDWDEEPFAAVVKDGVLFGRGAADMKGAIASFICAAERYLEEAGDDLAGSLSLLITGDEEGPAVNGTRKTLHWLREQGEQIDCCLVGEPTNPQELGEMIKIGRRGSLHGVLRVRGQEGHVAYPHLADNPVPKLLRVLVELTESPFDEGNAHFQPSNLEVLDLHVGNESDNVIPAEARARFNIRFNNEHTPDELMAKIRERCDSAGVRYDLDFRLSGDAFLTPPGRLSQAVSDAVEKRLGRRPELSTTGGTSDARFIKDVCPVVEFGMVGATMHKSNERAAVADLEALADIYLDVIRRLLRADGDT